MPSEFREQFTNLLILEFLLDVTAATTIRYNQFEFVAINCDNRSFTESEWSCLTDSVAAEQINFTNFCSTVFDFAVAAIGIKVKGWFIKVNYCI